MREKEKDGGEGGGGGIKAGYYPGQEKKNSADSSLNESLKRRGGLKGCLPENFTVENSTGDYDQSIILSKGTVHQVNDSASFNFRHRQ